MKTSHILDEHLLDWELAEKSVNRKTDLLLRIIIRDLTP